MSAVFDLFQKARGRSTDKATIEEQQYRLGRCSQCSLNGKYANGVCGFIGKEGCGCVISQKVKYINETCPNRHW